MRVCVDEIMNELLQQLWLQYSKRVPYAQRYYKLLRSKNGQLSFDHVAFRALNALTGEQPGGIRAFRHLLHFFGYQKAGQYAFPKKHLTAVHFEHSNGLLPRFFVSQLEVEELPVWAVRIIKEHVAETPYLLSDKTLELLNILKEKGELPRLAVDVLIPDLLQYFRRPWKIPKREDVMSLHELSQYAAWVLLYGNAVNHFAIAVQNQGVSEWADIEVCAASLVAAGIPMKENIEGERGSKLRQTATYSAPGMVLVRAENGSETISWPYAYLELTERGRCTENGQEKLFSGFIDRQASHLFEMTRLS